MKGWKDHARGTGEEVGLYIGRFEPIHLGHETIIKQMLVDKLDTIVIAIGGATGARTFKNPWSFAERSIMINIAFEELKKDIANGPNWNVKLRIIGIPDYISDYRWQQDLKVRMEGITNKEDDITIYGYEKDQSSYYLKFFPEWGYKECETIFQLDATTIREKMYMKELVQKAKPYGEFNEMKMVSDGVLNFINGWSESEEFRLLRQEWEFIQTFQKQFEGLKNKPVFVTVDALFITRDREVLLLKRKEYPGLNMFAMPGGFINYDLTLRQSIDAIVEKKLGIDISNIKHTKMEVIDKPGRSLRGRTVTNVFVFENFKWDGLLKQGEFVKIGNLGMYRQQMFEDHFMIIDHLLY